MSIKKHNWILYFISITIITTIAVQFYWNYKNYELNKQRVINEVQYSLNKAIDLYFSDLSKSNFFAIVESDSIANSKISLKNKVWNQFITVSKDSNKQTLYKNKLPEEVTSLDFSTSDQKKFKKIDSLFFKTIIIDTQNEILNDSAYKQTLEIKQITQLDNNLKKGINIKNSGNINNVSVFHGKKATDSLKLIKDLKTIFISIQNDSLELQKVDSITKTILLKKKINTNFYLDHYKCDTLYNSSKITNSANSYGLKIQALSSFLKSGENINLIYSNPTLETLKRSSTGILLSLILSLAVIASLFYLLKIINQQKELAEIKNDLISNITHEFKTPITTVSTAIEAIDNFNIIDDKEKTKKYLSISAVQLKKLHQMVEKLLETATLDSEKLLLKKEETDIIELIEKVTKKHQLISNDKTIQFFKNINNYSINIDVFHIENAISNLIDNAIKYGGSKIDVNVSLILNTIEITIADNGNGIDKNQQSKIFDKFYRVPKGNTHDVKGFGIGLYYTKKIIEKHNGVITLSSNSERTIFKIDLPNEH
ncbi:HAMP domain-containing sensor histidine kinase [Tenacibaculum sp. 190524A02b]|uniref:sensor histidine kinase n=1 Tax=Tenacibaculum vairaonense TaxID=3137860 RepID=UPI0031FB2E76